MAIDTDDIDSLIQELSKCPECGGQITSDEFKGEEVCAKCGLVISEKKIDHRRAERNFIDKADRTHDSTVDRTRTDLGLGTEIGRSHDYKMKRLSKINNRAKIADGKGRNLLQARRQLEKYVSNMELGDSYFERAMLIYKKASDADLIKGRSIEEVAAASLYSVLRNDNVARNAKDIEKVSGVNSKNTLRTYKVLIKKLNIKKNIQLPSIEKYIIRTCGEFEEELGTERRMKIEHEALELYKSSDAKYPGMFSGMNPRVVSATVFYVTALLMGENITQGKVAQKLDVTEVSLRNGARFISDHTDYKVFRGKALD